MCKAKYDFRLRNPFKPSLEGGNTVGTVKGKAHGNVFPSSSSFLVTTTATLCSMSDDRRQEGASSERNVNIKEAHLVEIEIVICSSAKNEI